jgi:hypothetical protein
LVLEGKKKGSSARHGALASRHSAEAVLLTLHHGTTKSLITYVQAAQRHGVCPRVLLAAFGLGELAFSM